jgi:hypothetical protein
MRAVCAVVFFISGFMKKDLFFPDRFLFHFSFLMGLRTVTKTEPYDHKKGHETLLVLVLAVVF